jgi:hypothetical protein
MKTIIKTFVFTTLVVSLNACGLFDSNKPVDDTETKVDVSIDSNGTKIDTLHTTDSPAKDTGVTIIEEEKEQIKK